MARNQLDYLNRVSPNDSALITIKPGDRLLDS